MKRLILPLAICFAFVVGSALAYRVAKDGGLYWDSLGIPPADSSIACDAGGPESARLYERVIVEEGGLAILNEIRDTGIRGFEQQGAGLAVENPWALSVETDDFTGGVEYHVKFCWWWEVYGSCDGGPVVTQTICVKEVRDGQIVPFDAECCQDGGTFTGTGLYPIYLPLIYKEAP